MSQEKIKKLEEDLQYFKNREFKDQNYIRLWDLQIPLDEEIKRNLNKHISDTIRDMLGSDKELEQSFITAALNYKAAFIRIFKPIVKEIMEELDFRVQFDSQEGG